MIAWSPCAALPVRCELSGSPELERLARPVFAPFNADTSAQELWTWHARREADGSWSCECDEGTMWRAPDAAALLSAVEFDCVHRLVRHIEGSELFGLHGALLSRGDAAICLTGHKEAGKSTLSLALWQSGWQLGADDFSLVRVEEGRALAFPVARRVSLRSSSRALLGEALWKRLDELPSTHVTPFGALFHPDELRPEAQLNRLAPHRLKALFFVESNANVPMVEPLRSTEAMFELLAQTTLLGGDGSGAPDLARWGVALPPLGAFTSALVSFRLRRAPLPAMIGAIEEISSLP